MCGCAGFDGSNTNGQAVKQQPVTEMDAPKNSSLFDERSTRVLAGVAVGVILFFAYKKFYA